MALLPSFQNYWNQVSLLRERGHGVILSGNELTIAHLVASSRYDVTPELSGEARVKEKVDQSKQWLSGRLAKAGTEAVYAVNTGVGDRGKAVNHLFSLANTRTSAIYDLQRSLLEAAFCGIVPPPPSAKPEHNPTFHPSSLLLPESWVRGTILVRLNTLIRGMSGVSWDVLERFRQLLVHDIIPCVPARQSISASGDLATLGYIAGSIQYKIPTRVWAGERGNRRITTSYEALGKYFPEPVEFGPKEVIATINGTAPSCAVATLALHDSIVLAHVSQVLTAMTVEALTGTLESFDPFLHEVCRPHPGQVEVAQNCTRMLKSSQLAAFFNDDDPVAKLRQDRYSTRTSPQWIGPQIEELQAGIKTLEIEMNSTSDNPIIDVEGDRDLHGGNFQGTAISVVMEKTRVGLQHMGKIAYAQMAELVNLRMNRGLPPDLAAGEPSLDFGFKGIDIGTAAYLSELSFMSNTVTNHVQSAELHNQSINSLALVSARTTYNAIQLLQMIFANHLFALCQALDLRAMSLTFLAAMKEEIRMSLSKTGLDDQQLLEKLFRLARFQYAVTGDQDSGTRFNEVVKVLSNDWIAAVVQTSSEKPEDTNIGSAAEVLSGLEELAVNLRSLFRKNRDLYFKEGSAEHLLGGTKHLYNFVRKTLGVKMLNGLGLNSECTDVQLSRIYESFDSGAIIAPVLASLSSGM